MKFSASEITSPTRFTVSSQYSHVSSEDETAATKTHYLVSATPPGWPRFSPPAEPQTCLPAPHQAETSPLFSRAKAEAEKLTEIYTSSLFYIPPYSYLPCASSFAKATPLLRSPPLESSLPPHPWSPLTSHCQNQQLLSLPVVRHHPVLSDPRAPSPSSVQTKARGWVCAELSSPGSRGPRRALPLTPGSPEGSPPASQSPARMTAGCPAGLAAHPRALRRG